MPDVAGDSSTTSSVSVGSVVAGSIETASDHDWFRIDLVAGQSITVSLNGTGASPLSDPYLRIMDSAGTLLAQNDDGGPGLNSLLSFTATTTGTYYIDASAWSTEIGDYTLSVNPFTPPPVATISQFANQLTNGYWDGSSHHFNVTQGGSLTVNLTALTADGVNVARLALRQWSDVIGVNFVEVSGTAQITFDDDREGAFSTAQWSSGGITSSAIVNVSTQWLTDYGSTINSYGFQTYIHEIGHALGLGHAGNYNTTAEYPTDALFQNDAWSMSVMSYFSQTENSYFSEQGFTRSYVGTPMVVDIAAVSVLYGLSTTTRTGGTTYGFNSNAGDVYNATLYPTLAYTVFDSGGIDTLDYSGFSQNQHINLTSGQFSDIGGRTGNVNIAIGTVIENAIGGSGNDEMRGNDGDNILRGNGGADVINGLGGNDTLIGGSGDDRLIGGDGIDTASYADAAAAITYFNQSAHSTVGGEAGIGFDDLFDIEAVIGSAFNDSITGNIFMQRIDGGGGNDFLSMSSNRGGTLIGGSGADTFSDTQINHNGQIILDFATEDRIVIADANFNSFTFSLSGSTLTYTGGSMTLLGVTGQLRASAVAGGVGVSLQLVPSQFADPALVLNNFGSNASAGGWSTDDRYPRMLADVNGDGRIDIVGFGESGVYVSLGTASGAFGAMTLATTAFGAGAAAGSWSSNNTYLRVLADVNGDGRADIVGFGNAGVYVALAGANGMFAAPTLATTAFGVAASAGGWSSDTTYARQVVDVNGDSRADIVGFGIDGVLVSFGNANGSFSAPILGLHQFGVSAAAGGWSSDNLFPRELGDVNGDGRIDIVGFGNDGAYVALGNGNGTFQASTLDLHHFGLQGSAGGWSSDNAFPRHLADVNHDGAADIVGFASNGVIIALSHGDLFI